MDTFTGIVLEFEVFLKLKMSKTRILFLTDNNQGHIG